jgi:hypothetical protein
MRNLQSPGARCDDFVVLQHSSFFACRYVGQDGILRPIANRPNAANFHLSHAFNAAAATNGI